MVKQLLLVFFFWGLLYPGFTEAKILFPFKGEINFQDKELFVTFQIDETNALSVKITQADENIYHAVINIDHLKVASFDISSILESTIEIRQGRNDAVEVLKGTISSKYTLINYKPVPEISGQFDFKKDTINFHSLSMGNIFCQGSTQIVPPYHMDIVVKLTAVEMPDFISFFAGQSEVMSEGLVEGKIRISGEGMRPSVKTNLSSYDGFVDEIKYHNILLKSEGVFPVIDVSSSTIVTDDGVPFNIAGLIDLSAKGELGKQIHALTITPLVSNKDGQFEWTLKRIQAEDKSGTTELKYLLRRGEEREGIGKDGDDMFEIQRTMEF